MDEIVLRIAIHLLCFFICLYTLEGIDFSKFIHKGKTHKATILYFLVSMALGYLVAQFLLMIAVRYY